MSANVWKLATSTISSMIFFAMSQAKHCYFLTARGYQIETAKKTQVWTLRHEAMNDFECCAAGSAWPGAISNPRFIHVHNWMGFSYGMLHTELCPQQWRNYSVVRLRNDEKIHQFELWVMEQWLNWMLSYGVDFARCNQQSQTYPKA